MIQAQDDELIEELKEKTGAPTKIDVVRRALRLLEADVDKQGQIKKWRKAVALVGDDNLKEGRLFISRGRLKKIL